MIRRATVLFSALLLAACKADPPAPPPPAVTSAPAPPAVDHVEPGELPEGKETAFGLPIPRGMRVDARFADEVRARGDVPPSSLVSYVRARLIADRVDAAPSKTEFVRATLKAKPERTLRVEVVELARGGSELIVRDVTRPPAQGAVKPTDPWDKPGFDPKDGRADPRRFE